jgi:hypothetical protein
MTTKRNRRVWAIGPSLFAALLVIGVIANAFGTPTAATKADRPHGAAAHPLPSCLDSHAYYPAAMTDLSAAARAAEQGGSGTARRRVRAAGRLMTKVDDELTPAHRRRAPARIDWLGRRVVGGRLARLSGVRP